MGREIIEHLKMSFMIARYYSIKMKLLKRLNKMGDYLVRNKEGFEIQEANKTLNDIRRIIEGEIRR